jgi:Protein of unknown function (DUF2911)
MQALKIINLTHIFKPVFLTRNEFHMKKTVLIRMFALICMGVLVSGHSWAQQEDKSKRPSPPATAKGKIKDATITIDYSSPSVKGRKIFGSLLPYGEVWRAGANEATIFSTDKDIEVEGKKLAAGKYSLFMTPGEKEWTVFFNSETGQWGDTHDGKANMDPAKTVLKVQVKAKEESRVEEKLVYAIIDKPLDKGFQLSWDKTRVFVSIK